MSQRNYFEESMDASQSPAFVPVCDRLKSVFEPPVATAVPNELDRLLLALEDAYSRGELHGAAKTVMIARAG